MGWRFRQRIKLLPGVHLNFGLRGVTLSLGGAPMTFNIGRRKSRTTMSIPSTGISFVSTGAIPDAMSSASEQSFSRLDISDQSNAVPYSAIGNALFRAARFVKRLFQGLLIAAAILLLIGFLANVFLPSAEGAPQSLPDKVDPVKSPAAFNVTSPKESYNVGPR